MVAVPARRMRARRFSSSSVNCSSLAARTARTVDMMPPPVQESLAASIPFPSRLGRPEEFAETVGFILGNRYLNGETIRLDGAVRLAPR